MGVRFLEEVAITTNPCYKETVNKLYHSIIRVWVGWMYETHKGIKEEFSQFCQKSEDKINHSNNTDSKEINKFNKRNKN